MNSEHEPKLLLAVLLIFIIVIVAGFFQRNNLAKHQLGNKTDNDNQGISPSKGKFKK